MTRTDLAAMIAVAHAHAAAEGARDLEATMTTLDNDPTYELQPMGRTLRGRDVARAYYEQYTLHINDRAGIGPRQDIIGILMFGSDGKLSGERIYASDALIQFMFGPLLDRAEPD